MSPLSNTVAAKKGGYFESRRTTQSDYENIMPRRHDTIKNLAFEFEVSERTIRRDIEILSYTEPIYTQRGRYEGGVHIVDGYYFDRMYMSKEELGVWKSYTYAQKSKRSAISHQRN